MMPYSKPAFLALPSCQVPFSANAYSPVANSCQLVVCVLLMTEFGRNPASQAGPQRHCGHGRRGIELGQVRPRSPEPWQELEAALLGADRREGDALLPRGRHLAQCGGQTASP